MSQLKKTAVYLDGEWECDTDETISFNSSTNTFKVKDIEDDYYNVDCDLKILEYNTKYENGASTYEYNIVVTGEGGEDEITSVNYGVTIYGSNQNMMVLYNTDFDETYRCEKIN